MRGGRVVVVAVFAATLLLVRVGVAWANAGDLDTTFNGTGKVTTAFGSDAAFANALAIQSDGKIVAAGATEVSGHHRFTLARYLGE